MRRFELSDSTSNKFWEVDVKGKTLNATFGKIGTKGQSKPKDFATSEKAKAEMEKLIKEKTGKGYVEVGGKAVKAEKPGVAKNTNAGSMGEGLSKAEKQAKAEKVLLMFEGGQWELARGILEVAQDEHWLFEELLEGCSVKKGKPTFSTLIKKLLSGRISVTAELSMLEVLLHLPKELQKLQKLREKLGVKLRVTMLSKYWIEIGKGEFYGVNYDDPENFTDKWYKAREAEIAKVEKEGEVRSKALNKAWREEEDLGKGVVLEMILIPAGKFMIGPPKKEDGRYDDEAQHEVTMDNPYYMGKIVYEVTEEQYADEAQQDEVTLTKSYYMGKYEVTQEQWQAIMGSNNSSVKGARLPVTNVSWIDCQYFIKRLNAKTNGGYRLPTEAEWEYACRAGTTTAYSFGAKITPKDANYRDSGIGKPVEVGSYKPNAFGLYDMHGNVNEWCEDMYGDYPSELTDPKGPATGECRELRGGVWRGGSFESPVLEARSSSRYGSSPTDRSSSYGFRLARTK